MSHVNHKFNASPVVDVNQYPMVAASYSVAISLRKRVERSGPGHMIEIKIALTLILFAILFFAIYFTAIPG